MIIQPQLIAVGVGIVSGTVVTFAEKTGWNPKIVSFVHWFFGGLGSAAGVYLQTGDVTQSAIALVTGLLASHGINSAVGTPLLKK